MNAGRFSVSKAIAMLLIFLVCGLISCQSRDAGEKEKKAPASGKTEAADGRYHNHCGECHEDIYKLWNKSRHAKAAKTGYFLGTEGEFRKLTGVNLPRGKEFCRTCHAPTLPGVEAKTDGVVCQFCHSVKDVKLGRKPSPFIMGSGDTKYGPLADVESPDHATERNEIFTNSRLCAGCHEYRTEAGLPILSTYSEWEKSGFKEQGIHCQTCHMSEVAGDIVDPKLKRNGGAKINLHRFVGGHKPEQLHKAVRVKILKVRQEGDKLAVSVEVDNKGAGHSFPTGMPTRKVVVEASIEVSGEEVRSEKIVLKRVLGDKDGKPIKGAASLFHRAVSVLSDTLLAPQEKRVLTFTLPFQRDRGGKLWVKLRYIDDPAPGTVEPYQNVFFSRRRIISPR